MRGNYESIVALAEEIEREDRVKDDLLVDTRQMGMTEDGQGITIMDHGAYGLTPYAHGQLAQKLGIPKQYYDRIGGVFGLRQAVVGDHFNLDPSRRLVRTLDRKARAILSDRFKPVDNHLVMQAILPVFKDFRNLSLTVKSASLSDTRMYVQLVFPDIKGEVKPGDVVNSGITITNSEVGAGAYDIRQWVWNLVCSNGQVRESLIRSYHVGRRIGDDEQDYNIYRNDTIMAELESLRLRTRDVLAHTINQAAFDKVVNKMREADQDQIEKPVKAIENVTSRFKLFEADGQKMLTYMADPKIPQHGFTRYGMAQSITALAREIEDKDRAYEMEKIGSQVIDLKESEWKALVN